MESKDLQRAVSMIDDCKKVKQSVRIELTKVKKDLGKEGRRLI